MSEKVYRSELTPVSFLRRSAYMFPEKTAVVYGERRHTYAELEERVNRLASRLRDSGLEKGERVAFLCPNTPPMLEGHFAVPAAGLVLVAINTRLGKDEVTYIVEHSGAKMVFVDAELEDLLADVDEEVERVRIDDTGEAGDPVRGLPGRRVARARRERAGGRGRDHLHQLHLGDDGTAEGRHVHAPRRVPERSRQRHRDRDGLRDQVPVDPPHVPLQRVDLSRGP